MDRLLVRAIFCCLVFTLVLAAVPVAPKAGRISDSAAFGSRLNGPPANDANDRLPLFLFDHDDEGEWDAPEDEGFLRGKTYGYGGFNPGHHGYDCADASVPEPATYGFLGVGMIGLALLRRRIRHT